MLLANYHVHSDYCDGTNTLEEIASRNHGGTNQFGSDKPFPCLFGNDWMNETRKYRTLSGRY